MFGFRRLLTAFLGAPARQPCRVRLGGDGLEDRTVPALSSSEAYGWYLVNQMRADPPKFADELENLYWNRPVTGHGVSNTDPVWADLRQTINTAYNPNNFWLSLEMMRAQPKLGPLGWDASLEQISDDHNAWMASHAFAHSWWNDPVTNPKPDGSPLPGLPGTGIHGDYDLINPTVLGANFGGYGEDIGYDSGAALPAVRAQLGTGTAAHRQRQAYADTIGYLTEVNAGDFGHLTNLLSRDHAADANSQLLGLNAIGVDYDFYDSGLTGGTTNFVSTHTLSQRARPTGAGGYLAGMVYRDLNNNGAYDVGEGIQATVQISGAAATSYGTTAANFGLVSALLPANGSYTVTVVSGGRTLARRTVNIADNNAWAEFRFSPSFNLLTEGGTGSATPTLAADLNEGALGNNTALTATDLGAFTSDSGPPRPTVGLSITAGDQDWFKFAVANTTAANIRIGFANANGNLNATLYKVTSNGALSVVGTGNGTADDEVFARTLAAGTYYLAVLGGGGATNFYSLAADLKVDPTALYADFGSYGLAKWAGGSGWTSLHGVNPDGVTTAPDGTLYVDYGIYGVYSWTAATGFVWLNANNPDGLAAGPDGFLYADYGSFGLARWSAATGWQSIHSVNPDGIAVGANGTLYVDYGIYGLYSWTAAGGFVWLNANNPDGIAAGGGTVYADFGSYGFARMTTLGNWQVLRTDNPDAIAVGSDGNVYASYNSSGVYRSSTLSIAWTRITTNPADSLAVGSDGNLYLDLGARGLWRYTPLGNWRLLNANNPDGFAVA